LHHQRERSAAASSSVVGPVLVSSQPPQRKVAITSPARKKASEEVAVLRKLREVLRDEQLAPLPRAEAEREVLRLQQQLGEIEITSDLAGAAITIDGVLCGYTPLPEPIVVAPGEYQLALRRHGYQTLERRVVVGAGERQYRRFAANELDRVATSLP
jgi:hypothetical protein